MPGVTLQGTVTTEVQLAPKARVAVLKDLREYQKVCQQLKDLEQKKTDLKAKVDALREAEGLDGFEIDGFTVTMVASSRSVLDQKKLVALGCKTEWLKKATEQVPSKPYILITPPKAE